MANNRVFLSWSGSRAKEIAQIWKSLIEESFDSVDAFVSSQDIDPGERGLSAIKEQLDGTSVGIPIITRDNVNAPWINFESGALSKQVPNAQVMVMPCLVDYADPSELTGPLLQFQAQLLNKDGVASILETIAKANLIDWHRKKPAFDARWSDFEKRFNVFRDSSPVPGKAHALRPEPDMLAEIVNNTRELRKMLSSAQRVLFADVPGGRSALEVAWDELYEVRQSFLDFIQQAQAQIFGEVVIDSDLNRSVIFWTWTDECRDLLQEFVLRHNIRAAYEVKSIRLIEPGGKPLRIKRSPGGWRKPQD
ncbi:TIR domain-containing protein [Mycobacteroides abscessus]